MRFNPIIVALRSIGLLLMGRVQFPKVHIGTTVLVEDGEYAGRRFPFPEL